RASRGLRPAENPNKILFDQRALPGDHPPCIQPRYCIPADLSSGILEKTDSTQATFKLFLIPGELTRPGNRPILRLRQSSMLQALADDVLRRVRRIKPIKP